MSKLREQTLELLQTLRDARTGERAINRAAKAWMMALESPESLQEILDAQRELASAIEWDDVERAQLALTMSSVLVERGFAPEPLLEAFAAHLPAWLQDANRLLARAQESSGALESGALELDEAAFQTAAAQLPGEARSWERLESLSFALVAALSANPDARGDWRPLLPQLLPLADFVESASLLVSLLRVLENAPILVLEPARGRGFVGTISGVADNWQLHALLMAHYPDVAPISAGQIAVFRGDGPQQMEQTLTGAWNLTNYRALDLQGRLLADLTDSAHWIWNEDAPADIEEFDGYRAILLGPPAYQRVGQVRRLFAALRADIRVERELNAGEVENWLQRLAGAK